MGMDAHISVIGHFKLLKDLDVLSYPNNYYEDVKDTDFVEGFLYGVEGNSASKQLAELFGFGAWDLGKHLITDLPNDIHYDDFDLLENPKRIIKIARELLLEPSTIIFYHPNG